MEKIAMGIVRSSVVKRIGFSGDAKTHGILRVELHDGSTHDYPDTSFSEVKRLMKAKSIGAHFNKFVRGRKDV
jgi:hypothetical protein